jgi:hypothetical protein
LRPAFSCSFTSRRSSRRVIGVPPSLAGLVEERGVTAGVGEVGGVADARGMLGGRCGAIFGGGDSNCLTSSDGVGVIRRDGWVGAAAGVALTRGDEEADADGVVIGVASGFPLPSGIGARLGACGVIADDGVRLGDGVVAGAVGDVSTDGVGDKRGLMLGRGVIGVVAGVGVNPAPGDGRGLTVGRGVTADREGAADAVAVLVARGNEFGPGLVLAVALGWAVKLRTGVVAGDADDSARFGAGVALACGATVLSGATVAEAWLVAAPRSGLTNVFGGAFGGGVASARILFRACSAA